MTDWQDNDWVVHQRLVAQTDERLQLLKNAPSDITIVGADFDLSRQALQQRFPQAGLTEWDARAEYLQASAERRAQKHSMWQKLIAKKTRQRHESLLQSGHTASADLLWGNLAFVAEGEPTALFEQWSDVLRKDGLLYFTHFGPDTLNEVRDVLQVQGIVSSSARFWDMHDLGDMLFHHGFYDPVMDVERVRLSYSSTGRFWRDMEILQLWRALDIAEEQQARAKQAVEAAIADERLNTVTLEIVYGHAVKQLRLPENESLLNFYPSKPQ